MPSNLPKTYEIFVIISALASKKIRENKGTLFQGYRNRYDIIDHEHEKNTFMYFFHRPIFAKIREFATIVLLNGIERFSESTLNSS